MAKRSFFFVIFFSLQTTVIVGDKDLAIEATQEAFVRTFEQFGTLRERDKFSSCVLTDQKNT